MMRKYLLLIICMVLGMGAKAQNWDHIRTSGEYYYGVGQGATESDADNNAMADMIKMISTSVQSDFRQRFEETNTNGNLNAEQSIQSCIKTYSQATINNSEKWVIGKEPNVTVRRYMKRSEMERVYADRITRAKDMIRTADEALKTAKVDMALQYYYWAYTLVRSIQHPGEAKDEQGNMLINSLPAKMGEIMSNVTVKLDNREDEFVDLLFLYNGKPVSSIEFTYNDGRAECAGFAKDGRGMIEMIPEFAGNTYFVNIEYEYLGQSRGDAEMESVLNVIPRRPFRDSEKKIMAMNNVPARPQAKKRVQAEAACTGVILEPQKSQVVDDNKQYGDVVNNVMKAIKTRNYAQADQYFTIEGLEMYNKLIKYGTARVMDNAKPVYFKGSNGGVVVRGMQMAFSFKTGRKKTYVEDVAFTFNTQGKICNVAFGLGNVAENDILCKHTGWKDETKELLMEFLEDYKTAYCLKRADYLEQIFSDDALIIVGNILKRSTTTQREGDEISENGQNIIRYNRYTKSEYISRLRRTFARNEFLNIRFTHNEIQWLEKFMSAEYTSRHPAKELYAIQIGQEYDSSRYADIGYLFLLVDMTEHDMPQIKIRTWQPNECDINKLYNAGDFYDE